MLTQERYHMIEELVNRKGAVTITELTKQIPASESTIRRDLQALDELGKVKKVHGGATAIEQIFITNEEDVNTKKTQNVEEKEKIAKYAASLVRENDFIYLDAGTTTDCMIDFMDVKLSCVVTNAVAHAKRLSELGCA